VQFNIQLLPAISPHAVHKNTTSTSHFSQKPLQKPQKPVAKKIPEIIART